jgi:MFS family permease
MTVFCGLAQTFWHLVVARLGVGLGESGAIAPVHSLIADYFPPERRATALGGFTAAAAAGYVLGFGLGGYLAATQGWRSAFLLAGVPGLALALIVRFTLAEPRLQRGLRDVNQPENLRETMIRLGAKQSFLYALVGCLLYFFFTYSVGNFVPSYLVRVLHTPLTRASVTYGLVEAAASLIGTIAGGWVADRLARRNIRWFAWLPAITFAVAGTISMLQFAVDSLWRFMALDFVSTSMLAGGLPSVFAAIHAVCGNRRRATAIAVVLLSATLFGGGLGPLASGALSDALSAVYGPVGLRYSLMTMICILIVAGSALYYCGRAMPNDLED